MSENEYIEKITALINECDKATAETIVLADEAVLAFPNSSVLWCLRGDLIQLADEVFYELEEALRSYQQALVVDPNSASASESIGFYYDAVMDDPRNALPAFERAIYLGAEADSYFGLARVLAELNKKEEALSLLSKEKCPFYDNAEIKQIRDEIELGMWLPN